MDAVFVSHEKDEMGMVALRRLKALGYNTRVLSGKITGLNPTDVALFTRKGSQTIHGGTGKWLQTSSIKFSLDNAPKWACLTPYRVRVIRVTPANSKQSAMGFDNALRTMAKGYLRFNPKTPSILPWGARADQYTNRGQTSGIDMVAGVKAFLKAITGG